MRLSFVQNRFFTVFAIGFAYGCVAFGAAAAPERPVAGFYTNAPSPAPDIAFVDEAGKPKHLKQYKGQVVLVNFWATWCTPCISEMPAIAALQKEFGSKGFKVLAISEDAFSPAQIKKFYTSYNIHGLGIYADPDNAAFFKLKLRGLPISFIINREGKQVAKIVGAYNWQSKDMRAFISGLLK